MASWPYLWGADAAITRARARALLAARSHLPVPKVPGGPKRLFEEPARLVLRHAGVTVTYQENDGHLRKRDKSEQRGISVTRLGQILKVRQGRFGMVQVTWTEIAEPETI